MRKQRCPITCNCLCHDFGGGPITGRCLDKTGAHEGSKEADELVDNVSKMTMHYVSNLEASDWASPPQYG